MIGMMNMPTVGSLQMPQMPQMNQGMGRFESLMANPLLHMGMGLLAAGQDGNINPYQAAMQGMMNAQRYRDHYDDKRTKKQKEEAEKNLAKMLMSGDPSLNQLAGALAQTGNVGGAADLIANQLRQQASDKQWENRFKLQQDAMDSRQESSLQAAGEQLAARLAAQDERLRTQLDAQDQRAQKQMDLQRELAGQKFLADQEKAARAAEAKAVSALPELEQERDQLIAVEKDIRRAMELQGNSAWFQTGPLAQYTPTSSDEMQELESLYKKLGVDRLSNFSGATSEKELAVAFQAGAHMGADTPANLKLLQSQLDAVLASRARNAGQMARLGLSNRPTGNSPGTNTENGFVPIEDLVKKYANP